MRLYNKNIKPRGSIDFYETGHGIRLQFPSDSKLFLDFRKMINQFLKKHKLKIVNSQASFRTHKNKKYTKKKGGFDTFYKWINPHTQKVELKYIEKD